MRTIGRRSETSICGNGVIEAGEDCDCGMSKNCVSVEACCNPRTCRFYPGAECLSGSCCSGCKLLPPGYTCRTTRNNCDVAETCDGISPQCPDDQYIMDGTSCPESSGTCFHGQCGGAEQQCVELWGSGAKVAHDSCYTNFNPTGSMTGHCGYDSRLHKYIPCFDQDVKCGLLHCQGGLPYPRVSSTNFMVFHVNTRDGSFECKSISSPMQSILVNDGTICNSKSFCQNNTCVEQDPSISSCHPEKNCSNNGICTSNGQCYCYPRWKGTDCSIFDGNYQDVNIYSNRSLSLSSNAISSTTFTGIATISFFLLILCIIVSCLLRRKKSSRQVRKAHQHSINLPLPTAQITINPQDIEPDQQQQHSVVIPSPYDDSHLISTPMSMHRTPFMASSRSITSACTGLSFVGNDTPRSMRYTPARKISTTAAIESTAGIFSDSETSRTRIRRPTRSPYLHNNHHTRPQQTYATMKIKRPEATVHYRPSRKIYDDINHLSTNENFREFIQVLDSLAQEKFGGTEIDTQIFGKESQMASSPTDTNESITLDSGYQSTKQLINHDEYAVVMKNKNPSSSSSSSSEQQKCFSQRRRSYSSIDNHQVSFYPATHI